MSGGPRPAAVGLAATFLVAVVAAGGAAGGATTPSFATAFAAAAVLAAGLACLAARGSPGLSPASSTPEAWGLACAAWAAVAAVPLPAAVVDALAPYTAAARVAAVGDAAGPLSLDAGATALAALGLVAWVLLARGARRLVEAGGAVALARATAAAVVLHGGAALLRGRYGEDDPLLLRWAMKSALNAWGTFPNRTQAAAFLLVGAGAALGLAVRGPRLLDRGLGAVAVAVATASVAASGSRAGVAGVVLALAGVAAARRGRGRVLVAAAAAAAVVVGVAGAAGVGPAARALAWRANEGTRFEIWSGTVHLAARQPVGVGLGAFPYAYPGDGRGPTDRWAGIAESDVLQAGVEFGVPGALLLGAAAVAAVRALRRDRRAVGPSGLAPALAVAGLVAAVPVALTGSPFHAPAVAAAGAVAWAVARGLVRGHDAAGPPGYRTPSS
ncbi:MAG: O-antigen ligase family protein [Planctomycetota bacterium]